MEARGAGRGKSRPEAGGKGPGRNQVEAPERERHPRWRPQGRRRWSCSVECVRKDDVFRVDGCCEVGGVYIRVSHPSRDSQGKSEVGAPGAWEDHQSCLVRIQGIGDEGGAKRTRVCAARRGQMSSLTLSVASSKTSTEHPCASYGFRVWG